MDERAYARYMSDVAYFLTRMEQNPNAKYFMPVTLAYNKMEKYDQAIALCKNAVARFPTYCPAKTLLAEAYIYKGEAAEAKPLLFDVITEDPENYKALKLLGTIYKSSDETGEALKYFKAAYIRAPEDEDLKRSIEELGGSVTPDDLFEEYMKKNKDSLWSGSDDKSYKDIEQNIHAAEVMMTDLVADTKISDGLSTSGYIEDGGLKGDPNFLSEIELAKLLTGADKPDGESLQSQKPLPKLDSDKISDSELDSLLSGAENLVTDASRHKDAVPENESSSISDDELNKLFAGAAAPSVSQPPFNTPSDKTDGRDIKNIENNITNSQEYSDIENILKNSEIADKGDFGAVEVSGDISAADLLSALNSTEESSMDKAADESMGVDFSNIPFQDDEAIPEKPLSKEKSSSAFLTSGGSENPLGNAVATEDKGSDGEFFRLDEDDLNVQQGFTDDTGLAQSSKKHEEVPEAKVEEPQSAEFHTDEEKVGISETAPMENVAEILSEGGSEPKPSEESETPSEIENKEQEPSIPEFSDDIEKIATGEYALDDIIGSSPADKNYMEFKLEDMLGDDKDDLVREEDSSTKEHIGGESAPFAQRDILDEILAASETADEEQAISEEIVPDGAPHSEKAVSDNDAAENSEMEKIFAINSEDDASEYKIIEDTEPEKALAVNTEEGDIAEGGRDLEPTDDLNIGFDDDDKPLSKEKAKERLLKLQARLEKLKKGENI